jgi:hypothetical protein
MSDNPYLVTVGASNVSYRETEDDATLAADLAKTIGWLQESKAEYEELAAKIEANAIWFTSRDMSHPKYEQYGEIFNDQRDRATALLDRLETLRSVGKGEVDRMSSAGQALHRILVKELLALDTWVRQIRKEAAERDNAPF